MPMPRRSISRDNQIARENSSARPEQSGRRSKLITGRRKNSAKQDVEDSSRSTAASRAITANDPEVALKEEIEADLE